MAVRATASITGAWVALADCLSWMKARSMVGDGVLRDHDRSGLVRHLPSDAGARSRLRGRFRSRYRRKLRDDRRGKIVEVQGTAEKEPFSEEELLKLLGLARKGVEQLVGLQKLAVA